MTAPIWSASITGWWSEWRARRRARGRYRLVETPLRDHTAEDPETFESPWSLDSVLRPEFDQAWREQGKVPIVPTEASVRWVRTKFGFHYVGCRYAGKKPTPLPDILSVEQAADYAEANLLRPCHMCRPLDQAAAPETKTISLV
jgi:hypothetical protein